MDGETTITMEVDQPQAESIAIAIESAFTRIPAQYDYLSYIMKFFGLRLSKVIINDRGCFSKNAELFFTDRFSEISIDSQAGEAIASAVIVDAPIFLDKALLETADKKQLQKWLSYIKPSDFGNIQ